MNLLWAKIINFFFRKLSLLSHFCELNDKVVASSFSGKKYGDNPMCILEEVHHLSPSTELVWIAAKGHTYVCPSYVRVLEYGYKLSLIKEIVSAKILIDNNRFFYKWHRNNNTLWIQTWHGGLGIKKIGADNHEKIFKKDKSSYDFYISNSDHLTNVYRSAYGYVGPVWKCGYPIEDRIFDSISNKKSLCDEKNIDYDTHIVLYAPTYRSMYEWKSTIDILAIKKAFSKRFGGKWEVIVNLHQNACSTSNHISEAITLVTSLNIESLIYTADAFISDYSSSIFQAVQRGIPCFIFADDYDKYDYYNGLYYGFDELPFPCAFDNDELINSIINFDELTWRKKWNTFQKKMGHIVTGHSAEDIAKVCVDFLNGKSKKEIMNEIPFETDI